MSHAYKQIDVFTTEALKGNPLAVVFGADDLSDAQMQAFARWTNLSETTFLLKPTQVEADYRVRIFTPASELPFAGHPTLGSCHAWLEAGGMPKTPGPIVQECGVGLVVLKQEDSRLAFADSPSSGICTITSSARCRHRASRRAASSCADPSSDHKHFPRNVSTRSVARFGDARRASRASSDGTDPSSRFSSSSPSQCGELASAPSAVYASSIG